MKKIGLMAFHAANNFGANLQIYSTYSYLENHGYKPILINYIPKDANAFNNRSIYTSEQVQAHNDFISRMDMTKWCSDSKEVADVIKEYGIDGVIIGSDAIAQHHPFFSRIIFPSKRHIVSFERPTSDRMFPNAFWGEFQQYLDSPVPTAILSASNQQSDFRQLTPWIKRRMRKMLAQIGYISARDEWTQKMYQNIFHGKREVPITPDPVFAFNYNVKNIPSKQEILDRFGLKDNYILLAVINPRILTNEWIIEFEKICNDNEKCCVAFPFPFGLQNNKILEHRIELPLSPIDWYALIRYASGFVGNNMHTVISALSNDVPLFCFDQYGIKHLNYFNVMESSKIYDILHRAGFDENRCHCGKIYDTLPEPEYVFDILKHFDKEKCRAFTDMYLKLYLKMMNQITTLF